MQWKRKPQITAFRFFAAPIDIDDNNGTMRGTAHVSADEIMARQQAIELLDCITCPDQESDPEYNHTKVIVREKLLIANTYNVSII